MQTTDLLFEEFLAELLAANCENNDPNSCLKIQQLITTYSNEYIKIRTKQYKDNLEANFRL